MNGVGIKVNNKQLVANELAVEMRNNTKVVVNELTKLCNILNSGQTFLFLNGRPGFFA